MSSLVEKLNFNNKEMQDSICISTQKNVQYYIECFFDYCIRYSIDLSEYSDNEVQSAIETMADHNRTIQTEYWFSID